MQEHSEGTSKQDVSETSSILSRDITVVIRNFTVALQKMIWMPLLLSFLLGAGMYWRNRNPGVYTYTSKAVFSVSANFSSTTDILSYSYYYDKAAASQLGATFPYVIQSDAMNMLLRQDLNVDYINGNIVAGSIADASLFILTVTSPSPKDAYDILNAVIRVYPQAAVAVMGDTQITIIDAPVIPTEPNEVYDAKGPTIKGILVGFLAGVALVLVLSLTRKTVHAAADLRKLINVPCLGYVPQVYFKKRKSNKEQKITIRNPKVGTSFIESVRSLRHKVLKEMNKLEDAHVLMVTSTIPHEGKSTVSANLALSLAADGYNVVLIDADMRIQSLKSAMGIERPSTGLVDLLSGDVNQIDLLRLEKPEVYIMCGDNTTDRPQRLLDSGRMRSVIADLRKTMDYIIIDTPPAGVLSDAATMAKYADAALYVVHQDMASTYQIYESIQMFSNSGVKIVGTVLNGTHHGTTYYGYGGKYKYTYGYGYGKSYGYGYGYGYGRPYSNYNTESEG